MKELEKAKELMENITEALLSNGSGINKQSVKACAIICVNEILNTLKKILGSGEFTTEYEKKKIEYYQSVKTHIQNL